MQPDTPPTKAELRSQMRGVLRSLSLDYQQDASRRIRERLKSQRIWSEVRSILFYAPLPGEPDVWPLIDEALKAGKVVALPRFVPEDAGYAAFQVEHPLEEVTPGPYGIREPKPMGPPLPVNQLDFLLIPGVAFDVNGHRLGRGKGFYDRLLASVHRPICGVAFEEQMVERLPVEPHDIQLSCILTPTRWQEFARQRAVLE